MELPAVGDTLAAHAEAALDEAGGGEAQADRAAGAHFALTQPGLTALLAPVFVGLGYSQGEADSLAVVVAEGVATGRRGHSQLDSERTQFRLDLLRVRP